MPSFASNTTKAMSQNSIQVGLISFSAVFGMIFPRKLNCSFPLEFVSSGHVSVGETRFCKCRVLGQMDDNIFNFLTDFSEQSHVGNSHQHGINLDNKTAFAKYALFYHQVEDQSSNVFCAQIVGREHQIEVHRTA